MRSLAYLLGHDHPLFAYNLAQLEQATRGAGVDNRLYADSTEKAHECMRKLRLDPSDTLPMEVYRALLSSVAKGEAEALLEDTDYVLVDVGGEVISFNLEDVIESAHHELQFIDRSLEHARRHLRGEIIRRYADHEKTDHEMVHRLAEEAGLKPARDEGHAELPHVEFGKKPSLYAIGDIFSDVFIQLLEEESSVEEDENGNEWLKLPFGTKPPYESATTIDAVGPSPNAGVSAARLGVDVSLLAWIGDDKASIESRKYLDSQNIDHSQMVSAPNTPSNTYYVLRRGAERTILVKDQAYKYEWRDPEHVPDWLYLSLISDESWQLHEDMLKYLDEHPQVKLAFQPGTFHFEWGVEKCRPIYARSEIVIMNREEAVDVTGGDHGDLRGLLAKLRELGSKIAVITDGKDGSYASYDDTYISMPNYPDSGPPVDRTGAGDAFASTIVAALALGESVETALRWAPINSMNVVQQLGAQAGLQTRSKIEDWLKKAPDDYVIGEIH